MSAAYDSLLLGVKEGGGAKGTAPIMKLLPLPAIEGAGGVKEGGQ